MFFSNFFIVFVVKIYFPKVVYTLDHTFFQKKKVLVESTALRLS